MTWPPGEYQGKPTPPSITLEEGRRDGETWKNTRIGLTLDKTPNVIQNLQIAYAKALESQAKPPETEAGATQKEISKPVDQTKYLKTVILEAMQPDKVHSNIDLAGMAKVDSWVTDALTQKAINELLEEGKIRPKYEGLNLKGFSKPT